MQPTKLLLITGRSLKQGTGLNNGKDTADYRQAVTTVELNQADMARLNVQDGDTVRLKSADGEAMGRCLAANLPAGMAFIAYGPVSSQLMGRETQGSGMPDSKGFEVEVERAG
jgi:formylmethanofuran dehydrogenase subunit D